MANRGTHVTSHQELNLGKKEKRLLIDPSFQLICPGFSENDILTGNIFPAYAPRPYVNDASPTELKKMFSNLRNLGLIVPISTVNGETRFGFGDEVNHNCSEDQNLP